MPLSPMHGMSLLQGLLRYVLFCLRQLIISCRVCCKCTAQRLIAASLQLSFLKSLRHVFHTTMHKPNLWICATGLFQGDTTAIEQQIGTQSGDSLADSPFVRALSKASMYVVVRNSTCDLYSRIWCVAELLHSKQMGLIPDRAFVTGPDNFSGLITSCLDAQAFNPIDRDRILRILLNEHNREEIDDFVHQFRSYEAPRPNPGFLAGVPLKALLVGGLALCVIIIVGVAVGVAVGSLDPNRTVTPTFQNITASPASSAPTSALAPASLLTTTAPTSIPTTQRQALKGELPDYSAGALNISSSPQSMALEWLIIWLNDRPQLSINEEWRKLQLFALVTFYYSVNRDILSAGTSNWAIQAVSECSWSFVGADDPYFGDTERKMFETECDADGRIKLISINLMPGLVPQGWTWPPEVALLTSLEKLRYDLSSLKGIVSDFIPTQLQSLTRLTHLSFQANGDLLHGTIPAHIGSLIGLEELWLRANGLTGPIPTELGLLTPLTSLLLDNNQLTGTFPTELGRLTALRYGEGSFSWNDLRGTIPQEICDVNINNFNLDCDDDNKKNVCPPNCGCQGYFDGNGGSCDG